MKRMAWAGICGLVLTLLFILAGCSGAGTSGGSTQITETLYSVGSLDGHVSGLGPSPNSPWGSSGDVFVLGEGEFSVMPVVSFNLSTLPAGATVTSATLRVYLTDDTVIGTHPFSIFGGVKVDHITFLTFDISVYSSTALQTFTPYIATAVDTAAGYKELDVTQAVQDDLNQGRDYSQYRLYHDVSTNSNSSEDSVGWLMAESMTYVPELVVKFTE